MFVGHALLAFALAALVADWRGWPARRALTVGAVAGAFAAIPDVDVVYAAVALDPSGLTGDALARPGTFWDATRGAHRSMTHSLVVALIAGPAFGLWAVDEADAPLAGTAARIGSTVALAALVGVAVLASGAPGGIVVGAFAVAGLGVATLCRTGTDLPARIVALAATAALLSHPWGDLVTGQPPRLFYPLEVGLFEGRIVLHADPTGHLLGAFTLELAVVWLAALALARVTDVPRPHHLDRRAAVGALYGMTAVAMTPPTLDVSYHFVFSILSVGLLCGGLVSREPPSARVALGRSPTAALRSTGVSQFAVTALAATTAALVGYAVVYAVAVAPAG